MPQTTNLLSQIQVTGLLPEVRLGDTFLSRAGELAEDHHAEGVGEQHEVGPLNSRKDVWWQEVVFVMEVHQQPPVRGRAQERALGRGPFAWRSGGPSWDEGGSNLGDACGGGGLGVVLQEHRLYGLEKSRDDGIVPPSVASALRQSARIWWRVALSPVRQSLQAGSAT